MLCLAFLFITTATAQTIITGTVQDETTKEPVASAIAAVIGDSGIVSNVNTNEEGRFMLSLKRAGKYRLRVSFIGYGTINETFEAKADGDTVNFGSTLIETLPDFACVLIVLCEPAQSAA